MPNTLPEKELWRRRVDLSSWMWCPSWTLILLILFTCQGFGQTQRALSCPLQLSSILDLGRYQWLPVVLSLGGNDDTIHACWDVRTNDSGGGIWYARSLDGGATFLEPRLLLGNDLVNNIGVLSATGRDVYLGYTRRDPLNGRLYPAVQVSHDAGTSWEVKTMPYSDSFFRGIAVAESTIALLTTEAWDGKYYYRLLKSHNAGGSWSMVSEYLPAEVTSFSMLNNIAISADAFHVVNHDTVHGALGVIYRRSTDQGITWSIPDTLSTVTGDHAYNPSIAAAGEDDLYVVWADQQFGAGYTMFTGTIVIRHSSDGGISWSPAQVVSQIGTAGIPHLAALDSMVAVIWDNDLSSPDHPEVPFPIFMAVSFNKGETWCPIETISIDAPQPVPWNLDPNLLLSHGMIHTGWSTYDTVTWNYQVYFRNLQPTLNNIGVASDIPVGFNLTQNYPNPFNGRTSIRYHLPVKCHVTLHLYNVLGELVETLIDQVETPGMKTVDLEGNRLPSGVYYYRLLTKFYNETRGLVLLK